MHAKQLSVEIVRVCVRCARLFNDCMNYMQMGSRLVVVVV